MEDLSIVLLSPVRAIASSGRPALEAARHHGDREGRHYYTTAPGAASRVYSSGDPRGRHASHDKAHHHFGIT